MVSDKNKERINILFIIDMLCGAGGTENHLYYLSRYLDKDKFNCSVVSFNVKGSFVNRFRDCGVNVYHIPVARYYTFNALLKSFQLRKIIKENKIDIVQSFHFKSDTYGVVNAKLAGVKYILSSKRDTGDKKKKLHLFINRLCNCFVDKFIAVSDAVGKRVSADESVHESRLKTIYNGVDLEKYYVQNDGDRNDMRKKLGLKNDDFVVGTVAHFRPEKNYDVFFKAFDKVRKDRKNLKAVVVGQGPTYEHFEEFCKKQKIFEYVIFTGPVEDVRQYIAVMDIACLVPGSNEGFSNALLEEMAMGKPVIVTSVGGNAEAVTDGENGIVIPPYDYMELVDAIKCLYDDSGKREEMGRKSREKVEKLFAIEDMIRNHEKFYEEIMIGTSVCA